MLVPLLIAALVWIVRRWRRVTPVKRALQELTALEANGGVPVREKLQALSMLMKRVALSLDARENVAGLAGEAWLRWLDEAAGGSRFREGSGRRLAEAPYRPDPSQAEVDELLGICRGWLWGGRFNQKTRLKGRQDLQRREPL
jgi:hypothetical protein